MAENREPLCLERENETLDLWTISEVARAKSWVPVSSLFKEIETLHFINCRRAGRHTEFKRFKHTGLVTLMRTDYQQGLTNEHIRTWSVLSSSYPQSLLCMLSALRYQLVDVMFAEMILIVESLSVSKALTFFLMYFRPLVGFSNVKIATLKSNPSYVA